MTIAFSLFLFQAFLWGADWAWGLPLIVLNAVIHVFVLALLSQRAGLFADRIIEHHHPLVAFVAAVGAITLLATCLHGIEGFIWATAYWLLGALPDFRSSVLYSLSAMTSLGSAHLALEYRWRLMGALEALNGWLLFGLTTAFLYTVVEKVWQLCNRVTSPTKQ